MTSRAEMFTTGGAGNDAGHLVLTAFTILFILAELFFAAAAFGRRFRLYAYTTAVVVVAFGGLVGPQAAKLADGQPTPWMGLYEWISIGGWLLWMTVLAATLLRERRTPGEVTGDLATDTSRSTNPIRAREHRDPAAARRTRRRRIAGRPRDPALPRRPWTAHRRRGIVIAAVLLFLLVVARLAGLVRQVEDQAVQLAALARNDGLTGLPNRRTWDAELSRHCANARRDGSPLCVVIIDLDHFKAYNDTHGHQGGDQLLKTASATWAATLRPLDVLARYGGEEFGFLLPATWQPEALAITERLRAVTPLGVTISAGVARWDGSEDPGALVARADAALYAAKRNGRNRVMAAPGGAPPTANYARTTTEQSAI